MKLGDIAGFCHSPVGFMFLVYFVFSLPDSEIGEVFKFKALNQANPQYWELIHSDLVYFWIY